jgi:hypothetical protein
MASEFGRFQSLFEKPTGYLSLLSLRTSDIDDVVARILRIVRSGNVSDDIDRLLADVNWRPHLVGAIAMVLAADPGRSVSRAWEAVDSGSWVTPQLLVCLAFADRGFPGEARKRLSSGWEILTPGIASSLERHVATGPGGADSRTGKAIASLVAVCEIYEELRPWVDSIRADAFTQEVLSRDVDNSGEIVQEWRGRLIERLELLGESPLTRWRGDG